MKNYDGAKFNNSSQSHALRRVKPDQQFFQEQDKSSCGFDRHAYLVNRYHSLSYSRQSHTALLFSRAGTE